MNTVYMVVTRDSLGNVNRAFWTDKAYARLRYDEAVRQMRNEDWVSVEFVECVELEATKAQR